MNIREEIKALENEISSYRRALHENPGTSYEEEFAASLVAEKLEEWGIEFEKGIATTGIVATINGKKTDSSKSIGLRADMDALNMTEKSGQEWASKIPGKMHGCGHDGHTATLLGAAKYLKEHNNFNGTVHLIFQPAEEGDRGADTMIEEGLFKRFPCDAIYGMHNWPNLNKGKIETRSGPIMASADVFTITIKGKGSHAATPHHSTDPIVIGAQIITATQAIVSRNIDPIDTAVVSVTNFNCGTGAENVIDDTAVLTGTVRTFREETRCFIEKRLKDIAKGIAEPFDASIEYEYRRQIDPTSNEPEQTKFCTSVAKEILGDENVNDDVEPCMGGEDFGSMAQIIPGCYVWIGQREKDDPDSPHNNMNHSPFYDFNDTIIPVCIEYWVKLVERALPI